MDFFGQIEVEDGDEATYGTETGQDEVKVPELNAELVRRFEQLQENSLPVEASQVQDARSQLRRGPTRLNEYGELVTEALGDEQEELVDDEIDAKRTLMLINETKNPEEKLRIIKKEVEILERFAERCKSESQLNDAYFVIDLLIAEITKIDSKEKKTEKMLLKRSISLIEQKLDSNL